MKVLPAVAIPGIDSEDREMLSPILGIVEKVDVAAELLLLDAQFFEFSFGVPLKTARTCGVSQVAIFRNVCRNAFFPVLICVLKLAYLYSENENGSN